MVTVWLAIAGTDGREEVRTRSLGESKSRNKVSVGEPAEGSLSCFGSMARASRRSPLVSRTQHTHLSPNYQTGRRACRAHEAPCLLTVRSHTFGVLVARWGPTVTALSSLGLEFGRVLSLKSCLFLAAAPFSFFFFFFCETLAGTWTTV